MGRASDYARGQGIGRLRESEVLLSLCSCLLLTLGKSSASSCYTVARHLRAFIGWWGSVDRTKNFCLGF